MGSLLLLARVVLAAVFAVAGIAKLFDLAGSRQSLRHFGVPDILAKPFALLLPLGELICAAALFFDASAEWGAEGVAVLLALFIAGISISLARGRKPDCHCFGQLHSEPVGAWTLVRNIVLFGLAGLVIWKGGEYPAAFPQLMGVETAMLTAIALLAVGLALTIWFLFHMLHQNGRLLVRLETLEKKLNIDPNAQVVPGLPVGDPAPPYPTESTAPSTLLVFTESGCGACDALKPELARWRTEYADRLSIHTVSDAETRHLYKVTATPSAVLIVDGKVASSLSEGVDAIRELVKRSTVPPPLKKGDPIPSIQLHNLDGATVDLASLRGRRTLVLFWSPNCGFCQQMLSDVKRWENNRPTHAPELLIISSGTAQENRQQGFGSLVLLDPDFGAGNVLGAGGTPSAIIIDEQGTVASEVRVGASEVLALAAS